MTEPLTPTAREAVTKCIEIVANSAGPTPEPLSAIRNACDQLRAYLATLPVGEAKGAVTEIVAKYRRMLQEVGGMDNELVGVPAGGVRNLLDQIERASQPVGEAKGEHRQGCDALGGYGHGVGPCTCGASQPVEAEAVADEAWCMRIAAAHSTPNCRCPYCTKYRALGWMPIAQAHPAPPEAVAKEDDEEVVDERTAPKDDARDAAKWEPWPNPDHIGKVGTFTYDGRFVPLDCEENRAIDRDRAAPPYPWCHQPDTCSKAGYCKRDPNCGE